MSYTVVAVEVRKRLRDACLACEETDQEFLFLLHPPTISSSFIELGQRDSLAPDAGLSIRVLILILDTQAGFLCRGEKSAPRTFHEFGCRKPACAGLKRCLISQPMLVRPSFHQEDGGLRHADQRAKFADVCRLNDDRTFEKRIVHEAFPSRCQAERGSGDFVPANATRRNGGHAISPVDYERLPSAGNEAECGEAT